MHKPNYCFGPANALLRSNRPDDRWTTTASFQTEKSCPSVLLCSGTWKMRLSRLNPIECAEQRLTKKLTQ